MRIGYGGMFVMVPLKVVTCVGLREWVWMDMRKWFRERSRCKGAVRWRARGDRFDSEIEVWQA